MTTAGGAPSGGLPLADITGRMAVFGRLFSENAGLKGPEQIQTARALVDLVRTRVPRTTQPAEDAPVFEAAAFIGEWLRPWAESTWIAEGPLEPHLQLIGTDGSVVYLLPLISILRVASIAGYDGLPELLESVVADVRDAPRRGPLTSMRVVPASDAPRVVRWIQKNADPTSTSQAVLWRRCQACSRVIEESLMLTLASKDWERDASMAAGELARRTFACPCGGPAGEVSRFIMLRHEGDEHRLADIFLGGTHTRVACWSTDGKLATPLDATALTISGLMS